MNRRNFIKNTGIVAAASVVPFVAQANDALPSGMHLLWDGSIWFDTTNNQTHPVNNLVDALRLSKDRPVFCIDIGDMPSYKAKVYLKEIADEYRSKYRLQHITCIGRRP